MSNKVLLVDDDWALSNVLKEVLQFEGYEVDVCNSAREALSKLEEVYYRTVITDYEMPGLTGIDFLELVLEDRRIPEKVILYSGRDKIDIPLYKLEKFGIRIWYIQKPFMNSLIGILEKYP